MPVDVPSLGSIPLSEASSAFLLFFWQSLYSSLLVPEQSDDVSRSITGGAGRSSSTTGPRAAFARPLFTYYTLLWSTPLTGFAVTVETARVLCEVCKIVILSLAAARALLFIHIVCVGFKEFEIKPGIFALVVSAWDFWCTHSSGGRFTTRGCLWQGNIKFHQLLPTQFRSFSPCLLIIRHIFIHLTNTLTIKFDFTICFVD